MPEIIVLHIGQTGIQVGHAMWELACLEHNVGRDGKPLLLTSDDSANIDSLFVHCSNGNYTPRALLVDLDPTVVDEVRAGHYRNLWNKSNLFGGHEDAASNYARAYYSQSQDRLPGVLDRIRILAEQCDGLNAFKLIFSVNGGTGSGLTVAILEELACNFGKKHRLATAIYPSPCSSQIVVEPYNATLHTASSIDFCDCVTVADNQAIHKILGIHSGPNAAGFTVTNRLLARLINAQCLSHRYNFTGQQKVEVGELLTNLVPYPRIHFPTMAYAPLFNQMAAMYESPSLINMLERIYEQEAQLSSVCIKNNPFISCALLFRGNVSPCQVNEALRNVKGNKRAEFVDWCPTSFKIGINFTPPIRVPSEGFPGLDSTCINMIAHNVGIREAWVRIADHYNRLYCKRAFVHWFVSEGLEEAEFVESQEVLVNIINDYEEIGRSLKDIACEAEQMQQSNVWMEKRRKISANGDCDHLKRALRSKVVSKSKEMVKLSTGGRRNLDVSASTSAESSVSQTQSYGGDLNTATGEKNKNTNCLVDPSPTLRRPIPRSRRTRFLTHDGGRVDLGTENTASVLVEGSDDITEWSERGGEVLLSREAAPEESLSSYFENSLSTVTVDWDD